MPRTEEYPHWIRKTRKEHECGRCGGIILKGSAVRYRNEFTGKRTYYHIPDSLCDPYIEKHRLKMKIINHPEDYGPNSN
jgi:hypothetical protein